MDRGCSYADPMAKVSKRRPNESKTSGWHRSLPSFPVLIPLLKFPSWFWNITLSNIDKSSRRSPRPASNICIGPVSIVSKLLYMKLCYTDLTRKGCIFSIVIIFISHQHFWALSSSAVRQIAFVINLGFLRHGYNYLSRGPARQYSLMSGREASFIRRVRKTEELYTSLRYHVSSGPHQVHKQVPVLKSKVLKLPYNTSHN